MKTKIEFIGIITIYIKLWDFFKILRLYFYRQINFGFKTTDWIIIPPGKVGLNQIPLNFSIGA